MPSAIIQSEILMFLHNKVYLMPYFLLSRNSCGPIFGAGADLLIANNCNTNMDSYSNLPHSYDGPNAAYLTLFGDYNFTVVDYEVYTLATNTTAAGVAMAGGSAGNNGNNSVSGNNASNNNNNNAAYSNTGNNNSSSNLSTNVVGGGIAAGVGGNGSGGGGGGGMHKPKYERY